MLTPTDVHYLVAFLSSVGQPEDVELELGALVWDENSETKRDVDVCVTRRLAGGVEGFVGIEVKAEARPLDVIAVEQLCAKLKDMPSLTARSIVSASGFTGPAARKAASHGVELLRIDDLDPARFTLGTTVMSPDLIVNSDNFVPTFTIDFDVVDRRGKQIRVRPTARVIGPAGRLRDAQELANSISRQVADTHRRSPEGAASEPGSDVHVSQLVSFDEPPFLVVRGERRPIRGAQVTGTIRREVRRVAPKLKTLVRHRDNTPFVDCAIAEMPDGELLLLAAQGAPSGVTLRQISVSERNRLMIRGEKWAGPRPR